MTNKQTVCLLNDSFPPQIDGVANAVQNYAKNLPDFGFASSVVTPSHPQADDSTFDYPVFRYPSVNFHMVEGYVAGIPFSPETVRQLSSENIVLLHTHCPIISTFMARELRQVVDAPIILTYHTKFDIDIANIIKSKALQSGSKKALVENISACDEVWTVSRGAGENLRGLGYEGDYIVMPNGVDVPRGTVSAEQIEVAIHGYDIPSDTPVYLFVGRMMWYKGLRLIIDALAKVNKAGKNFRAVFIGSGDDKAEVEAYAAQCGIADKCIFTGAIRERELLRAWYSRADLFLFPSTFDTNGLVVREAAACMTASVLVKGSCAAEDVTDGRNGFLIEENADSLSQCLLMLHENRDTMYTIGQNAGDELYLSWKDAVKAASERYLVVIDRYKSGCYPRHSRLLDGIMKLNGELMENLASIASKIKARNDYD